MDYYIDTRSFLLDSTRSTKFWARRLFFVAFYQKTASRAEILDIQQEFGGGIRLHSFVISYHKLFVNTSYVFPSKIPRVMRGIHDS